MKNTALFTLLFLALAGSSRAALWVDFGRAGQVLEPGYVGFDHPHENAATGATQNYATAFALTGAASVDVTGTWPNTTDLRVRQSIIRGGNNNATWTDATGVGLVQDYIGSDTRTFNGGNGNWDGAGGGTPTHMALILGGLPAGTYNWTSFHHDTENIHTDFQVTIDVGAGAIALANGYATDGTQGGNPNSELDGSPGRAFTFADMAAKGSIYNTTFTADGVNDVVFQFTPLSGEFGNGVHNQFFFLNGFQLEQVPEPSTSLLGLLGALLLLRRRR